MTENLIISFRALVALTFLTGVAYPFVTFAVGHLFFRKEINGSILTDSSGKSVGSLFLSQKFENPKYFWPRPSASDFATLPSGASNLGPTSQSLKEAILQRKSKFQGESIPDELVLASGSGLDPHLSIESIEFQLPRVAQARHWNESQVRQIKEKIQSLTESPDLGFLGKQRINVLRLNQESDGIL